MDNGFSLLSGVVSVAVILSLTIHLTVPERWRGIFCRQFVNQWVGWVVAVIGWSLWLKAVGV